MSRIREVEMIHYRLFLCTTVIAYFLIQADALPPMLMNDNSLGSAGGMAGDPLDPDQLGESMSNQMPPEFIQEAIKAGVITETNPLYKPDSERASKPAGAQSEAEADNSLNGVNVTGTWSFDLNGTVPEKMKLYLVQNKNMILGQGAVNSVNGTQKATASGSISGEKMALNVTTVGASNLYRLDLSLSALTSGTYTAYLADGDRRSGKVTFAVSSNIFRPGY